MPSRTTVRLVLFSAALLLLACSGILSSQEEASAIMPLAVVVLAAGKGKRMHSDLPKVLHPVGPRPLLGHVLVTAHELAADQRLVVYGHGGEAVRKAFTDTDVVWVEQAEQLGTGHAVAQAMPSVADDAIVLVLYGDVPLIRRETLLPLLNSARATKLALLTAVLDDPTGYGRIVRDERGQVVRIVEQKDATPQDLLIREINTGILAVSANYLKTWVAALSNDNAQGEYYLTDIIALAVQAGVAVEAFTVADPVEVQGVNNRLQLAELERHYQRWQAEDLLQAGVTLRDPTRLDVRGTLHVGRDVLIDVNVVFEGDVRLGDRVIIGPNTVIRNSDIGDDSEIRAFCHLDGVKIGCQAQIGPYARLRPETVLADQTHIGNFVEVKKAHVGHGSKVNHLTYIGDAQIGQGVNVGAGTITCNYDGANKHQTVIGDHAFIGSNTALVAPVRVGNNATVGAGSTITREVPDSHLAIARGQQRVIKDWQRPVKNKK